MGAQRVPLCATIQWQEPPSTVSHLQKRLWGNPQVGRGDSALPRSGHRTNKVTTLGSWNHYSHRTTPPADTPTSHGTEILGTPPGWSPNTCSLLRSALVFPKNQWQPGASILEWLCFTHHFPPSLLRSNIVSQKQRKGAKLFWCLNLGHQSLKLADPTPPLLCKASCPEATDLIPVCILGWPSCPSPPHRARRGCPWADDPHWYYLHLHHAVSAHYLINSGQRTASCMLFAIIKLETWSFTHACSKVLQKKE